MEQSFVRTTFRILLFVGMLYLQFALLYRVNHEKGVVLQWRHWNKVVLGAVICNTFTVSYWGLLAFGFPTQTIPEVSFWIGVFTFFELLTLGTHFWNGAINRTLERFLRRVSHLHAWICLQRERLSEWTNSFLG